MCYIIYLKGESNHASISDIIRDAESLPVEQRTQVIDSLLRSLNPPNPEVDRKWVAVAKKRLEELRAGDVQQFRVKRFLTKFTNAIPDELFLPSKCRRRIPGQHSLL